MITVFIIERKCYNLKRVNRVKGFYMHVYRRYRATIVSLQSLCGAQFSSHIAAFDKATEEDRTFGGPSLYFHYACIRKFAQVPIADKLDNLQFYEYLYATLASWGMHRMGDTATKLQNFAEFKSQIFAHHAIIGAPKRVLPEIVQPLNVGI
jgi:hypothetical protein